MNWPTKKQFEINEQGQRVLTTIHTPKSIQEYRQLLTFMYNKTKDTQYLKNVIDETHSKYAH